MNEKQITFVEKRGIKEIVASLQGYIDNCKKQPELLWDIPISGNASNVMPSRIYLSDKLSATSAQLSNQKSHAKPLVNKLKTLMINEGVIVNGHSSSALELRRNTLNWWRKLTINQKKELKVFGNSVCFNDYIQNWRGGKGYEIISDVKASINKEMIEVGLLSSDYTVVKNRSELRDKNFLPDAQKRTNRWNELRNSTIEDVNDLTSNEAIQEDPFPQIKHLFALASLGATSDSGIKKYISGMNHFITFLKQEGIPEGSKFKDTLSQFLLRRFKQDYLHPKLEDKSISPSQAEGILSAVRVFCNTAKNIKGLDFDFYDVEGFELRGRTAKTYKPYSPNERKSLNSAIQSDIKEITDLMQPYKSMDRSSHSYISNKDSYENRARVIFEDDLQCVPVFHNTPKLCKQGKRFLGLIKESDKGLHSTYKNWGIIPAVNKSILCPFVLRLAQILGMNADPILTLEIDDYQPRHHLTNKPCLTYWKERSDGEKTLYLDLFDAKLQWLTMSQSKEVEFIFNTVKKLTKGIRELVPENDKNRLFIYQNRNVEACNTLSQEYSKFVDKHNIIDDDRKPTVLTITRFRPSFVSDLIELGVSIREIQLLLGHASITTTMAYLDRLDFNRLARDKARTALSKIHKNTLVPPKKNNDSNERAQNKDRIIFQTPLSGCANIFNPPEFIKKSKLYVKGQPCSQYNKCLSCENIMITSIHLPQLFAMRRDYLIMIQKNRVLDTPYGIVIKENIYLLDEILNLNTSDFTKEELDQGNELSQFIESAVIDNFGG